MSIIRLTRERRYLAARGYIAMHVDYRNHAEADDDRVAMFGRSMGGRVVLKALIAEPGLVQAASVWASVPSLEAQNYDQLERDDPDVSDAPSARR